MKQEKIEDFMQQFFKLMPDDMRQYKHDMEKNIRAALQSTFNRMDLVTREEFDVQAALLSRTRELVQELEEKIRQFEDKLEQKNDS